MGCGIEMFFHPAGWDGMGCGIEIFSHPGDDRDGDRIARDGM